MAESTVTLDAIDRQVLRTLQEDGRIANNALAQSVGLTPTPMLQRLKRLEQSGAIEKYVAIVDPAAAGCPTLAFIHVTLKSHELGLHKSFVDLVQKLDEVLECHHIAGDEDFLLKVAVPDIPALEHFLLHRISTSKAIGRVKTTFVLSSSKKNSPLPVLG
ncbi:MAG: Lrp/AsnC family transcriptional regulator [Polyangiaceae bacterium]